MRNGTGTIEYRIRISGLLGVWNNILGTYKYFGTFSIFTLMRFFSHIFGCGF